MDKVTLWTVIAALGLGSFALRFVFLGLVGDRAMPPWLLRHLRYTAVAVMPALVAPLVLWPKATEGETDPLRLAAAAATLAVGYVTKNLYAAMGSGAAIMLLGLWLPG
jgi:branched-subunit amino acid transport protein